MFGKKWYFVILAMLIFSLVLVACGGDEEAEEPAAEEEVAETTEEEAEPPAEEEMEEPAEEEMEEPDKVCVVLDTGGENDRSFNEFSLKGARDAAEEVGMELSYIVSEAETDYEKNVNNYVEEGCEMIVTIGFLMGDVTAAAARANPDISFAIVDFDYFPGFGCDESLSDCYAEDLTNVASLMFAEDEVGYLAGVLAGCMSETGVIGTVSGMEIPPVVKFVVGYQSGARSQNPDIETLNVYIPDFNDPSTGKQSGQSMLDEGADIIFGVGGNTGNGGVLAAHEAGKWGIGVDVDQYFTYPDVASSLLTSAAKNMDVSVYDAVMRFANGTFIGERAQGTIANGGIGLAPYHDQEDNISDSCKAAVDEAATGLAAGTIDTGYSP
jgi:basic membrane protein A